MAGETTIALRKFSKEFGRCSSKFTQSKLKAWMKNTIVAWKCREVGITSTTKNKITHSMKTECIRTIITMTAMTTAVREICTEMTDSLQENLLEMEETCHDRTVICEPICVVDAMDSMGTLRGTTHVKHMMNPFSISVSIIKNRR